MRVNFLNFNYQQSMNLQNKGSQKSSFYPQSIPLQFDTVSFGRLKKSKFAGVDLAVVEKFKAPIEKFNTNEDFQNWCKNTIENVYLNKDYGARKNEADKQRKELLAEWTECLFAENSFSDAEALLVIDAITKDLKDNNDAVPPVLNKEILTATISQIKENMAANKKYSFDFKKLYETNLRAFYIKDSTGSENGTKWILIPSKENDTENFQANIKKLNIISHKNWCTKCFNADSYLANGDFHIYLEGGKPKLCIRLSGDEISEIQGELHNGKIPQKYLNEVKSRIADKGLALGDNAQKQLIAADNAKIKAAELNKLLGDAIKNNDAEKILPYFGIEIEKNEKGMLTISDYKLPKDTFAFSDLGISENKLFEKIKEIKGDAVFDSEVTNLGNLETIGGKADFSNSSLTDLGKLSSIGGKADFRRSKVTSLSNLCSIGRDADFRCSKITDLGKLEFVGGNADFAESQIVSLNNLKYISGYADFANSNVAELGKLCSIGKDAYFKNSKITSLANLEYIGANAYFSNSKVDNLGKLKNIARSVYIKNSNLSAENFKNINVGDEIVA